MMEVLKNQKQEPLELDSEPSIHASNIKSKFMVPHENIKADIKTQCKLTIKKEPESHDEKPILNPTSNSILPDTKHSLLGAQFKCDICNLGCASRNKLVLHMRTHSGEKPFKCDSCQRIFSRSSNLKAHLDTHNIGKAYVCELCEYTTKSFRNLHRHKRTHKK